MAKGVGNDRRAVLAKLGQFLGYERSDTNILQSDGVDHPACGLAQSWGGGSVHWFQREPFDHDPTQALQLHEVREFDAVTECATGGNDGILKMKGTDPDSEVNPRGPFGNACRLGRTHRRQSSTEVKFPRLVFPSGESPQRSPSGLC